MLRYPYPFLQLCSDWALQEWSTELPVGQASLLSSEAPDLHFGSLQCLFKEEKWVNSFHFTSFLPSFPRPDPQPRTLTNRQLIPLKNTSVQLQDAPLTPKKSWRSNFLKFSGVQMVIYSCDENRSWAWRSQIPEGTMLRVDAISSDSSMGGREVREVLPECSERYLYC